MGDLDFQEKWGIKSSIFLASQGRRLEAGAARVSLCGIVLVQLQTNNFSTVLFGHSASGHGQKVWVI